MEIIEKNPKFGIPPQEEKLFIPLVDRLRSVSSDKTLPNNKFVDLKTNIYDMISTVDDSLIESFIYDDKTNTITIKYTNGVVQNLQLKDDHLLYATYNSVENTVSLVMKYGEVVTLKLDDLTDKFYTKEEIDNKDFIKWCYF